MAPIPHGRGARAPDCGACSWPGGWPLPAAGGRPLARPDQTCLPQSLQKAN